MATVRITEAIRNHVRKKINEMFQDRFNAAHATLQSLPLADAAYDDTFPSKVMGLVEQLMKAQPDMNWFTQHPDAYVQIPLDPEHPLQADVVSNRRDNYVTRNRFHAPRPVPAGRSWTANYQLKRTNPIYPAAIAAIMEIKNLEAQQKKLETTLVGGVLEECTTLRQVLELWPTAMEFMPDEAKKRHAEPTAKRGASAKPAEVSVEVKAALMTARMLSSNRS